MKKREKTRPTSEEQEILLGLNVRLVLPHEQPWFDEIIKCEHYLHNATLVGEQLRYVAEYRGRWLALFCWSAAAYNLRYREAWLNWTPAQRSIRLPLIANNSRFWLPEDSHCPNLATRAMKLCLERLSDDWQREYGHPILVVESFVQKSMHGTCYKASNWQLLGETKGYGRTRDDYYTKHNQPKQLWVKELKPGYRELLKGRRLPEWAGSVEKNRVPACAETAEDLCGMVKHFSDIPDWRKRCGDYPVAGLVALVACATLCKIQRGQRDLAAFAATLNDKQMAALGFRRTGRPRQYTAPSETTFFRLLSNLDSRALERALQDWQDKVLGRRAKDDNLLAFDGKKLRSSQGLEITSLYAVKSGRWLGSELTESKSNEIPAAREILRRADLEGCLVVADALHTNAETARLIVQEKGADYLLPVKGNQKQLESNLDDLQQKLQKVFSPSTECRSRSES